MVVFSASVAGRFSPENQSVRALRTTLSGFIIDELNRIKVFSTFSFWFFICVSSTGIPIDLSFNAIERARLVLPDAFTTAMPGFFERVGY